MLSQTLSAGVLGVVWKTCNHGTLRKSRLKSTPKEYLVRTSHARLKYQVFMHWEKHRNNQISTWNKWVKWACLQIDLQTFPISSVRTESDLSVIFEASPSVKSVNVNRWNNKKLHLTYFYLRNSLTVFNVENHCSASNRRRLRDATASKTFDEFRKSLRPVMKILNSSQWIGLWTYSCCFFVRANWNPKL